MRTWTKLAAVAAVAGGLLALSACTQLRARDQLNKGVEDYKAAQFNAAIEHFQQAIKLEPNFIVARLYLATAYQSQFVPGGTSPENMKMGNQAVSVYKEVLQMQPNNANAVAGLAKIYYDMKDLDQARTFYQRQIQLEPNNPTPYYSIGVIDWMEAFQPNTELRRQLNTSDQTKPLLPAKATRKDVQACEELAQTSMSKIEEGMTNLEKAMSLRSDYADAMTYLNLLYRQKADMECTDKQAAQQDVVAANDWVSKSLAARKAEAAKAEELARKTGGIGNGSQQ